MSFITFSNPVIRKADKPSVDLLNSIYSGASPYLGPKVILTHTHTPHNGDVPNSGAALRGQTLSGSAQPGLSFKK